MSGANGKQGTNGHPAAEPVCKYFVDDGDNGPMYPCGVADCPRCGDEEAGTPSPLAARMGLAAVGTVQCGESIVPGEYVAWLGEPDRLPIWSDHRASGSNPDEAVLRLWEIMKPLLAARTERRRRATAERLEAERAALRAAAKVTPPEAIGPADRVEPGPTPPAFTPQRWAVLVCIPGDPAEPTDTGERVVARTEEEALAMAGARCNTGRVAVRPASSLEDWRAGLPAGVGA